MILEISAQVISTCRRQQLIDSGQLPGLTCGDHAELVAARKRIAELEDELAIHRRTGGAARRCGGRKRRYDAIAVMAAEKLPVQLATRVLGVSESGYYEWRSGSPGGAGGAARVADRAHPRCARPWPLAATASQYGESSGLRAPKGL